MGLGVMHMLLVHITNFHTTNFHLDVIDSLLGMKIWGLYHFIFSRVTQYQCFMRLVCSKVDTRP
jgi:hypothetical protein